MLRALIVALCVLPLVAASSPTWDSCADSSDLLSHVSVTFPNQPVKGQPFSIRVEGTLATDCVDGAVYIAVTLNGVSIYSTTQSMCGEHFSGKCPYAHGDITYTDIVSLPSFVPSGNYVVNLDFYDQGKDDEPELTCLNVHFGLSSNLRSRTLKRNF